MKFGKKILFIIGILSLVCEAKAANVAMIVPEVGDYANFGQELYQGAKIAVDIINDEGGLLGEKINLIKIDDRCEDAFSVSAAQMVSLNSSKKDKMNLVIGPYCNNEFYEIADIYAKSKVFRILPAPLNFKQYNYKAKGLIKISATSKDEAKKVFDFYKEEMFGNNIAVIYNSKIIQTMETAVELQQIFRENNIASQINLYDKDKIKLKDIIKEVSKFAKIVLVLEKGTIASKIVQEIQERNEKTEFLIDQYLATEEFFNDLGIYANGIYILSLNNLSENTDFTEKLVELRIEGKEPKGLGIYGYAAINLWKDAVQKAKSFDFDKLDKVIKEQQWEMPWGKVGFENGNISQSNEYSVYKYKNSEYILVN